MVGRQTNICVNKERGLVFFEGEDLCYNYRTGQWTELPAYDGFQYFGINRKAATLGLIRASGSSFAMEEQNTSGEAQTATFETGEIDPNPGGRSQINGVRPLHDGGTASIRVGTRDDLTTSVSYSTSTSINSRSKMANFRKEGRYVRVEAVFTGGGTTYNGLDIEWVPTGRT